MYRLPVSLGYLMVLCLSSLSLTKAAHGGIVTVDTSGSSAGGIGVFLEPSLSSNGGTFGQTFTVDPGFEWLTDFSFLINQSDASTTAGVDDFGLYISEWNGLRATGPILFQMDFESTAGTGPGNLEFSVAPNLNLTPGTEYVAFATASQFYNEVQGGVSMPIAGVSTSYSGGEFVFSHNGDDFDSLFTDTWDFHSGSNSSGFDTHFIATFSSQSTAVPEPSSLLLGLFVSVLGVIRRRPRLRLNARSSQ